MNIIAFLVTAMFVFLLVILRDLSSSSSLSILFWIKPMSAFTTPNPNSLYEF